jgi:tryptophanyl-tRNA synthetase
MSLRDASQKMSKSSKSDFTRINLIDSNDLIYRKIVKAKTDSIYEIAYDENRAELANLIRIYADLKGVSPVDLVSEAKWEDISVFKNELYLCLKQELEPIRERTFELLNSEELAKEMKEGTEKARTMASANLKEIKKLVGFME